MKKIVFRSAEQQYHLVTIFTQQHGSYHPSEGMLLDFIETYGLNIERQYQFTYSDDPRDEVEEFVTIDPKEYLDDNFESVCKSYLNKFSN